MMNRNLFLKNIFLTALLFFLTACSAFQPVAPAKLPLRVSYTQWWGDYTLLVAKDKGFFAQHGVDVEPVYYDVFSKTYSDLAAGQIDGAFIAIGDTININHNANMKVVGVSDDGGADAIVAIPGINTIEDLKGKTVGVLLGSQYELMITEMLRSVNMSPGDVTLVGVNPENAISVLKSGLVQAVYVWEPFLSEAVASGNKIIYPKEKVRLFPDLIVFQESLVASRPEDIRAFMQAWFEAVDYRLQHPQETQSIAAKYLGVNVQDVQPDNNLQVFTLEDNKTMFKLSEANSIYTLTKRTSDYLISVGALSQKVDPLQLITPDYLP